MDAVNRGDEQLESDSGPRTGNYPEMHFTTRVELRDWLTENADVSRGIWLVSWRGNGPRISYEEIIEECLRHGWIDSTLRKLDGTRSALRITPRRKGSAWSRSNKDRIRKLERQGSMLPSGGAAVASALADGSWNLLDDVEKLVVPDDLAQALAAAPGAAAGFEALAPSRRKGLLWWIKSAKRARTRSDRITRTVDEAAGGQRVPG